MKAIWNNQIIAESSDTIVVEGNHYFPPSSIKNEFIQKSEHRTTCPWKGKASYYHIIANEDKNSNAAWTYPQTSPAAKNIEGYVAFWHGVEVTP